MAWLAVNKDGTETISMEKPDRRGRGKEVYNKKTLQFEYSKENLYYWLYEEILQMCYDINYTFDLPKGSIKKLIGKELTWDDNPIELK